MLNRSNILVFVCGILIGVVLTIAATLVISRIKSITEKKIESIQNKRSDSQKETIGLYDELSSEVKYQFTECEATPMECGSYQIVQVFDNGDAEAWEMENYKGGYEIDSHMMPNCVSVILKAPENGSSYYDDQVIRLSSDQVSMRVGTMKMGKSTVPVVKIVER